MNSVQIQLVNTLVELFEQQVTQTPHAIAVTFQGKQITYRVLNEKANQVAHLLSNRYGVGPERIIGLLLDRSDLMVIAILGVFKAGGAYLPLDATHPAARLSFMLADSDAQVVLTDAQHASLLDPIFDKDVVILDQLNNESETSAFRQAPVLTPSTLAYCIYTSGTTGKPKGVLIEHGAITNEIEAYKTIFGFDQTDRQLVLANYTFDASVEQLFVPLTSGASVVLLSKMDQLDANLLERVIDEQGITHFQTTPSFLKGIKPRFYPTLKRVCVGGEPCAVELAREWAAHVQFFNKYGPTEAAVNVSYHPYDDRNDYKTQVPIGKPLPNNQLYIVDGNQQLVPTGVPGELYIGGVQLARGYLNDAVTTATKFVQNPFGEAGSRLYKTGDLAQWLPDGTIEFLGRFDDQVKIRGHRVELAEIEQVLGQHPAVDQCTVLAKEDPGGNAILLAYVTTKDAFDTAQLYTHLGRELPDYMLPAHVLVVPALPLTLSGKIDRKALLEISLKRPPLSVLYTAPVSPAEKQIAELWASVLQVDKVGVNDNFFELGGNSLLAVKTVALLAQQYAYHLPIAKLYHFATVRKIADYLSRDKEANDPAYAPKPGTTVSDQDVAVIGMSGRFPGANSIDELWEVLQQGKETTRFFADYELDITSEQRTNVNYVKARGVVDRADEFDPAFFGISPRLAELMDPQQRIFLEISWETLEQAGYVPETYVGAIGIFAGCRFNTYYQNNVSGHPDLVEKMGYLPVMHVNDRDYLASRVAYALNLTGPAVNVQSACSTSLLAIAQATESIRRGQCSMALAGGVSLTVPFNQGYLYQQGAMFSKDGHCKPFDAEASGTVFSDGAGVVLLKNRKLAEADGDTIYAVIKGVGLTNDGANKASFTAPSAEGQSKAIQMALADADVEPSTISYIETHGTATPVGDPIEIDGLLTAFGPQATRQFCALGSIKSNMGHLVAAAGVAGFIKTVLSLHKQQLAPSLFYKTPNPALDFTNSPFYVNNELQAWQANGVRRAGVSSFGVGGTNVHLILEEFERIKTNVPSDSGRPFQLITWSAKSPSSRDAYAPRLAEHLRHDPVNLADIAFTLQTTRAPFTHRRFAVADTRAQLLNKLDATTVPSHEARSVVETPGDVVFMFPGQGSQYINMGRELYQKEPVYRQAIDECAGLLGEALSSDIRSVLYPAISNQTASDQLNNTRYTQSALFVTEYALARLWMSWGIEPSILCGHSIGEFVAAHLAGIFSLSDALKLVAYRSQRVSQLPGGSMLAVRMAAEKLVAHLPDALNVAVINSPTSCVVSGPREAIAGLRDVLDQQQIANRLLATSHAFHSAMMDSIVTDFQRVIETVQLHAPKKRIVSTVSGTWLTDPQATDPNYWATHLRLTVRFSDALDTVLGQLNPVLLEVGPGNLVSTTVRQLKREKAVPALASLPASNDSADYPSVLQTLGQLWLEGLEPDWQQFYAHQHRLKVPLPTYVFDKKSYWIDPPLTATPNKNPMTTPPHEPLPNKSIATEPVHSRPSRKPDLLKQVKDLLEDVSGITLDDVRPDISFTEIGFDSLSTTQIALTLSKVFGVNITFRQLCEQYATLNALVDYLDSELPAQSEPAPVSQHSTQPVFSPVLPDLAAQNARLLQTQGTALLDVMAQQLQLMAEQIAILKRGDLLHAPASGVPVVKTTVSAPAKPVPTGEPELSPEEAAELKKPFGASARIDRLTTGLTPKQQTFLQQLTQRYTQKTKGSKNYTQEHRAYMADPRVVSGFKPQTKEIVYPLVVNKSKGSRLWDIDGNEYIDMLNGFGSNMLGHQPDFIVDALSRQVANGYEIGPQHELAGTVCKLIGEFTGFDRAALCSTGSEAVLGAIRIARTVTNRSLIVAFSGSYHGIIDEVIVRGSRKLKSYPAAPGIMPESVQNMLILDYGTDESLKIIRERAHELAAVLVEPIQSRRPEFRPVDFLHELRSITEASGAALIFDEVITGFRMHPGGAQALFGIKADLASYGKVIGAGLPIGVIAGRKKYLDALDGGFWQYGDESAPEAGVTYFAGTFVRHPLALAAAKASLQYMKAKGPALQQGLNAKGDWVANTLNSEFKRLRLPLYVAQFGSLWKIKYREEIPYSELLFSLMRERGIHVWEGFPCFITEAHTDEQLAWVVREFIDGTHQLMAAGFLKSAPGEPSDDPQRSTLNEPPRPGAKLGLDPDANPAWFVPDPAQQDHFQLVTEGALPGKPVDYNPFQGHPISHMAPTTEPQLELWTSCRLGGDDANRAYNESSSLYFLGAVNQEAMERAVRVLIQRHEALRSVFSGDGRHICFVEPVSIPLVCHDLSGKTPADAEQFVSDYVRQEALHVFDLTEGPLLRVSLINVSADACYLVLTTHHIICDGWSMGILLEDLGRLYSAFDQNTFLELPQAPSFSQYAEEHAQFIDSSTYEDILNFWLDQFKGDVPVLNLPTDAPRPALRTYQGDRQDYLLDPKDVAAIKTMGAQAGCSFVTTLMAVFEVFLHRLTGQDELVLGLPAAGQLATGNARLVGHCVNLLPLRSTLKADQGFLTYLRARKTSFLDAYEHQQLTFGSLLKKLNLDRDASRVPLVPVMFNLDMGKTEKVYFSGLDYKLISNPRAFESFELFVNASGSGSSFTLEWSYNSALFKPGTIARMMRDFEHVLRTIVADPQVLIGQIPLLEADTQLARLAGWNNTDADYPRDTALPGLIAETIRQYPAKVALRFRNQTMSYQQLDEAVNRIAHYLLQQNVGVGDVVAVALDRSPRLLCTLLAVMKVGAAYLPLDPGYPPDRTRFMLTDSSAQLLITSATYHSRFRNTVAQVCIDDINAAQLPLTAPEPAVAVAGSDLAYVLYTSGSTGQPKGVMITQQNLVNLLWSMRSVPGIGPDDVFLAITTISFDIAGLELYLPLLVGGTVVLADDEAVKDGRVLVDLVTSQQVSIMQATPATWRMMLDAGWTTPLPLKALCGGEALPTDLAEKLLACAEQLWNVYGPTETTIWSTIKRIDKPGAVTVGRPINNTQVYILDASSRPVPAGVEGEICIAGDGVGRGYMNRPALTAEKFVDNPFARSGAGKLYRTGDLGTFLANGEIQCLGRLDQQVKVRGYRIEPGDIEQALMTFDDIREAVVVAQEEQPGSSRLIAYVVPVNGIPPADLHDLIGEDKGERFSSRHTVHRSVAQWPDTSPEDVDASVWKDSARQWKKQLADQLPAYMIPSEFVVLPYLPLTPNGKLNRKALLVPGFNGIGNRSAYHAPQTAIETLIAKVWSACLKREKISVDDDFFELGGHSLIAIQVMSRLEKETGRRMPLSSLIEHSTIRKLALLFKEEPEDRPFRSLVTIKRGGGKMPLYIVHGANSEVLTFNSLALNLDEDQPVFGLQARGVNGVDEPLYSIEKMAAHYIAEIRQHNPGGPFALAGFSFGGLVAFEMNRQLMEMGEEVRLLALFDTYAYQSDHTKNRMNRLTNTAKVGFKSFLFDLGLLKRDPRGAIDYKLSSIKLKMEKLKKIYARYTYRKNGKHRPGDRMSKLAMSYKIASRNYQLTPQPVTIDLFRVEKRRYYVDDFEFLGWQPFALNGIKIHEVPGEHGTLFDPQHVKDLARILQRVLNK